ncbi:MAG: UvrD-helicase domain-containing protein [Lachnospiraceae bacterium]|nr:UvrD-helicase domain-containing protein [Lachnospiraceae bacterium]
METGLNKAQKEAVSATEGFIRVIAGAGSGKTRALSHRFAFLVNEAGILPGNILCVTFTNKAAAEMRERIHALTGDNDTGYICTFHSFCVTILQEDSYAVQYPKNFLVLDNADIDDMLRVVYEERGLTLRDMTFKNARDMIEIQKLFKKPEYYLDMLAFSPEALHEKYLLATNTQDIIFYGYLYQEKKCFGLDYNDLLKFTLYIFRQNEELRLKWQKRLEYIMIDEFQDIDGIQYELMEVLCGFHKNLFIVGDPDQTIYTWRGASTKYLLEFDQKFPGVKTILMTENYRSTPQIIAVVNSLISKNLHRIRKELVPTLPEGPEVVCHFAENPEKEAAWIAEEILKLRDEGVSLKDITILYRAHYLTRTVEDALRRAELPCRIYSGVPFFERKEIKDALSYLRMIAFRDDLSFRRIANTPTRNLGERRMRFLEEAAEKSGRSLYETLRASLEDELFKGTKAAQFVELVERFSTGYEERPVSELLSELLDKSGYERALRTEGGQERLDNLAELRQAVFEYETSCGEEHVLEHFLSHIALLTNSDTGETESERVKLMTVHAAKGLEFPYVFLCGMNEGIFPSKKTDTQMKMEEERRLAFVAMTRAGRGLYLSEAEGHNLDGSPRYPSRFLLDIDPALLHFTKKPADSLISDARSYIERSSDRLSEDTSSLTFPVGTRVSHLLFGPGTVEGIDQDRQAHIVRFDSLDTPRAISFKAKLEKSPVQP